MIYFMPICEAERMEVEYQAWLPLLPLARQEKLLRYRFTKDRWLCAAAYMLLIYGLQEEYSLTADQIVMAIADTGKPYLASHPHIYFNLSHCASGVACGISDAPMGIDVEVTSSVDHGVMKHVFTRAEQEIIVQSDNPSLTFTALWTLKESWVKAIGCGLSHSLCKVAVNLSPDKGLYINQDGYEATFLDQRNLCCISASWKIPTNNHISIYEVKSDMIL